jgi:hypothetical protein
MSQDLQQLLHIPLDYALIIKNIYIKSICWFYLLKPGYTVYVHVCMDRMLYRPNKIGRIVRDGRCISCNFSYISELFCFLFLEDCNKRKKRENSKEKRELES